ncbi:MAG TPA: 5-(carboxyamino)imidazole ribonucleotide mutase [Pyrinomonadaceae bacterium]|nr:5-(carboxyamino)imidazole ribonucleotide mutase [Pyrinomonadaceae bacterium]
MAESNATVSILMGSDSDLEVMSEAAKTLEKFGVSYEIDVTSAHRSPERTRGIVAEAPARGVRVFIIGAGAAAHLAGVVAAESTLPVIGVPLDASALKGVDALYATVQMPAGIPVATMAIGKAGATNAAIFAIEILALSDDQLRGKLQEHKRKLAEGVEQKSAALRERLNK